MQLVVNGKNAVLKKGSSFEYHSENRAFSDADDYTLSITLPLRGCPENLEIFSNIDRIDINSRHTILDASIIDGSFTKRGVISVTEVSDVEAKCQFLEGRSAQNFNVSFDDIYINELNLGLYPESELPERLPYEADPLGQGGEGNRCVALPWWNESSDGVMNNDVSWSLEKGEYEYALTTQTMGKLSYQPYLIAVAEWVCKAIGYEYDFTDWALSDDKYLLICNTLPASWDIPQFARALPHWTVSEFFSELEKILVCEIDIDHKVKRISLNFCDNIERTKNIVVLENVLDSFSAQVSYDDSICKFRGAANIRYSERGDTKWQLENCPWFVELMKITGLEYQEYDTEEDFWAEYFPLLLLEEEKVQARRPGSGHLFYIKSTNRWLMFRVEQSFNFGPGGVPYYPYVYVPVDVNLFGDLINDSESDNDIELKCVPAYIDSLGKNAGSALFLNPSEYAESEELDEDGIRQPLAYSMFMKGEKKDVPEYYDKIYLAYWNGESANERDFASTNYQLPPCPKVDARFSLSNRMQRYLPGVSINPKEKLSVSWIGDSIPDVRASFLIHGKLYLCEKITATFSETGMSQLLKGTFFPITD